MINTNNLTDVVKNLIIINVIIFFGATIFKFASALYLYFPASEYFQPYQLVTHMFMHGGTGHLFFNMLSLFFLGPYVERYLGSQKFLILYLISGFVAMACHVGVDFFQFYNGTLGKIIPMVGASGAIYGVMVAFALLFPNVEMMLLFFPVPIKAKYLAIGFIIYDSFFAVTGSWSNIAHLAHLGGALAGFVLIQFWRKNKYRID